MSRPTGSLFLVPNALDLGTAGIAASLDEVLPLGVLRTAARLEHWIAENAKSTRAFLKRVEAVVPLAQALQSISIVELPRPQKGGGARPSTANGAALLAPALSGADIGLLSEAGLPAVADPGASVVQTAHGLGIPVVALPGASSVLLALAASGLNGQSFAFVGYLPVDAAARSARIRELEALSRRTAQTQLMIETPYRNALLLTALLESLQGGTRVSVSCGLTLAGGFTRSDTVAAWRQQPVSVPADAPAVFSLLAG
jgi:16S rRNA (cytidine1402-2'-O)-methyltransferase